MTGLWLFPSCLIVFAVWLIASYATPASGQGPNLSGIAGITDIMGEFTDQPIESTDGELRLNAVVLVRPLSNRGAKSGEEGKDDCYEEETCASRIHKG
jgi:hypothetical protein